jgi:hypothetical protein
LDSAHERYAPWLGLQPVSKPLLSINQRNLEFLAGLHVSFSFFSLLVPLYLAFVMFWKVWVQIEHEKQCGHACQITRLGQRVSYRGHFWSRL